MQALLIALAAFIGFMIGAELVDKPGRRAVKVLLNSKPVSSVVLWYYAKKAEKLFPGPKRGPEKHEWVEQKAAKWKIDVCNGADDKIDRIVRFMNARSGKASGQIEDKAGKAVDELMDKLSGGDDG